MSDEAPRARQLARRRRANVEGGRQHRHEVKVTPEEEGMLLRLAHEQRVTVPRLLVESALASGTSETPTERRNAMAQLFGLHRLLASVSNNVNQMADRKSTRLNSSHVKSSYAVFCLKQKT